MPATHDFECPACGAVEEDVLMPSNFRHKRCKCGTYMTILWQYRKRPYIGIHPKDRSVIWFNPQNGRRATPGRNDVPMPSRYAKAGYVRREFETLRDLDKFCKSNKLVNEASHYNSNGKSYDDE